MNAQRSSGRAAGAAAKRSPGSPHGAEKTQAPQPPLRAFVVQEEYEGTGGIVYARHAIVARRAGANEFNGGEFHGITCKRAPWADAYAPGPCPKLVMIEAGWWFECSGCGRKVKDDADAEYRDEVSSARAIEIKADVYCSPTCRKNYLAKKTTETTKKLQAIQRLREALWRLTPGITFLGDDHAFMARDTGRWVRRQGIIYFSFPGAQYPATFRTDKPGEAPCVMVAGGDLEAWEKWRASQKKAAK